MKCLPVLFLKRPTHLDRWSFSFRRFNVKRSARDFGPLPHAVEPQSSLILILREYFSQIKPLAIILDSQFYSIPQFFQGEANEVCLAVFRNIVESFLRYPVDHRLQRERHSFFLDLGLFFDMDVGVSCFKISTESGEGG